MVTSKFYLDVRNVLPGRPAPLKIAINRHGVRTYLPLNISLLPEHWDALNQRIMGNQRQPLQTLIQEKKIEVDQILFQLERGGELAGLKAREIKTRLETALSPEPEPEKPRGILFQPRMDALIAQKSPGTKRVYQGTRNRLIAYLGEDGFQGLVFEDITVAWLREFDTFLAQTSPNVNARNIHFRNIRAVFNDALADEVITKYPFRRFKLRYEKTRKRALTVEQIRMFSTMEVEPWEERYRDCFILILLLRGINIVDLCNLRGANRDVIEYTRAKTHSPYTIRIEPEMRVLLDKYKGEKYLLNYMDTCSSYRCFYQHLNKCLNRLGERIGVRGLSTYWARHSWATIASILDIPKETIAAGLGHSGNTVTDIYIDFCQGKVDNANRRVIDWVFYGNAG